MDAASSSSARSPGHRPHGNGRTVDDPIAARIAEIARESKARAEAGLAVLGSVGGARQQQRCVGNHDEDDQVHDWDRHQAEEDDDEEEEEEEELPDEPAYARRFPAEEELSTRTTNALGTLIVDLLCSEDWSFPKMENELADEILSSQPVKEWAAVLRGVMLRIPTSVEVTFKAGTLRILRSHVTLFEAVRSMGVPWERVAVALKRLAQARLWEACTEPSSSCTVPVEGLLQAGANLFLVDSRGRTALHLAALAGSALLGRLLTAAPSLLLFEDKAGETPLGIAGQSASPADDSLVDAAFSCMANLPKRTARVLHSNPRTAAAWSRLAESAERATLLSAWDSDNSLEHSPVVSATEAAAEYREGFATAQLQQRAQRIAVLGSLATDKEAAAQAMEAQELRLQLAQTKAALQSEREAAAKSAEEQQREVQKLRALLAQREEELLASQLQVKAGRLSSADLDASASPSKEPESGSPKLALTLAPPDADAALYAEADAEAERECEFTCRERTVVEELRRSRLIGSEPSRLPTALRKGVAAMRASLKAAVERLSHDLYESEAHFLQELLQNADDNVYETTAPSLHFTLRRAGATAASTAEEGSTAGAYFFAENNERGLTEADVRALCDISRSSKSAVDGKTIGCKGIGWKSVFCVCDQPHVFSHGWRFRFGTHSLGKLTPEWVEEEDYARLPGEVIESHEKGNTVIYLPLRDSQALPGIEAEMVSMSEDPAQLLFLRRLQIVRFSGAGSGGTISVSVAGSPRDDRRTATLRQESGQSAPVRTEFVVQSQGDVTVAVPLVDDPQPQRIFAFLPVRTVGFRFAVQAPFHLTANRAGLHMSLENLRRRNIVANVFLDACRMDEKVASSALTYLGTVPTEPFWLPVYEAILGGLKSVACVETENGTAAEPSKCVLRGDDPAAAWISQDLLEKACGLKFARAPSHLQACRDLGLQSFGFWHLLKCLHHEDFALARTMWGSTSRSAFFSDVFGSLADELRREPVNLTAIQSLEIFPVLDSAGVAWTSALVLYAAPCSSLPLSWQATLAHCLHPDIELRQQGWRLLDLLGVQTADEKSLEAAAISFLLRAASADCRAPWHVQTLWASLAILCRCFVQGREPPVPWTTLRGALLLPSTSGGLLPSACLRLWSFCGVELRLPRVVVDTVYGFAGISYMLDGVGGLDRVATPVLEDPPGSALDWEVFLQALGCNPVDPTGEGCEGFLEATLQLGEVLSSGEFWREVAKSATTLSYLEGLLGAPAGRERLLWLRRLPVHLQGATHALEDLFLLEAFHGLAGEHLAYIQGVPEEPRVRALLRRLGISIEVDKTSLLKCLRSLRAQDVQDLGLAADIYSRLGELGLNQLPNEGLLLLPGRGYLHATDCTWLPFRNDLLQRCCRLNALKEHYGRFGSNVQASLEEWVRSSPDEDAGELCDALLAVVGCVKAHPGRPQATCGKPHVLPMDALEGIFEAAKGVVFALAGLCVLEASEEDGHALLQARVASNMAFGYFVQHRMIVLPRIEDDGPQCILLQMGEAYWSVEEELQGICCANFALDRHYGPSEQVRRFFTEVLRVRPVLTSETYHRLVFGSGFGRPNEVEGDVGEGLRFLPLPRSSSSQGAGTGGAPAAPFDLDRALMSGLQRAQSSAPPQPGLESEPRVPKGVPAPSRREWYRAGRLSGFSLFSATAAPVPWQGRPPNTRLLCLVCEAFGIHPSSVAFAYDPSGRCVCEERLHWNVAHLPRAALMSTQAQINFWAAELAHAVAHQAVGTQVSEEFLQVQSHLLLQVWELLQQAEGLSWPRSAPSSWHA